MYPDLVRSSCLNPYFQQGKLAISALNLFGYLPVCDGLTARPACAGTARGHSRATDHITADSGVDGSFRHLGPAVHQRDVCLLDLTTGELFCQLSVSQIGLSHQHQPTGLFVETMDDPRP